MMSSNGKNDGGVGGSAPADDETVRRVFTTMSGMSPDMPDAVRRVFGVNADGSPAEGGYTSVAREFAKMTASAFKAKAEHEKGAGRGKIARILRESQEVAAMRV